MTLSACLALDLGNSALKWAVYPISLNTPPISSRSLPILQGWFEHSFKNQPQDTSKNPIQFQEQLYASLSAITKSEKLQNDALSIIGCSVVPTLNETIETVCQSLFTQHPFNLSWLRPKHLEKLHLGEYPVACLGADRWANLLAAHYQYPRQSLLIADFGTATTLNVLLPDPGNPQTHQFAGGQILPGYKTFGSILTQKTAQLPLLEAVSEQTVGLLGKDTQSSLQAGLVYGYPAMIIAMMDAIQQEVADHTNKQPLKLLATGGLARVLQPKLQSYWGDALTINPHLTLQGIVCSTHATTN